MGTFRGTFDGNGCAVRNLTVDRAARSEVGLFASTGSGAVLRNVELRSADVTGNEFVGGLVGRNSGEVNASYTDATVEGYTAMGGVVGCSLGEVRNSYSTSKVSGRVIAGGIVGENRGDPVVSTSYSAGSVRALSEVKGVVGLNTGNVVTSYFDTESMRGRGSPVGEVIGVGLSTDEMTGEDARRTMQGLDFGGTWVTTDGYPVLARQMDGEDGTDGEEGTEDGTNGERADGEKDQDTVGGTSNGTTDDDSTDSGTSDETTDDGTDVGEDMPGFGFLAGTVALLGSLLLSQRFVSD